MSDWEVIPEFPKYSVSFDGKVRNDKTGRILSVVINQAGVAFVGMQGDDGEQYKRGLAKIVANAFLPPPHPITFDTPINLNGDRGDCHAENLMWRPRWFAVKYHQQFENDRRGLLVPIEEEKTGMRFHNSWEAATRFGLIDREILEAVQNRTYVWPTYQYFKVIQK